MFPLPLPFPLAVALLSSLTCWAAPQVSLGSATINGVAFLSEEFFGGIPYAQPPTGANRFKAPVLLSSPPSSPFDATKYGPPCIQAPPPAGMSEDCLSLNVLRPAGTTSTSNLPVLVWIYGGGFSDGTSSAYNATLLVRQGVSRGTPIIYVNLNYRLSIFGFPTGTEAKQQGATNLGLKDQLTALQWVHSNIHAFGGDNTKECHPTRNITVFGESAGAISIADLYLNSKLETLVRGAIMESGSQATLSAFTAESGDALWELFTQSVPSCKSAAQGKTLDCLRQASTTDLLTAASVAGGKNPGEFAFIPVVDGQGGLIPDLPSTLLAKGFFSKVPFIAGTNLDEGTIFTTTSVNSDPSILRALIGQVGTLQSKNSAFEGVQSLFLNILVSAYPDDPSQGSPYNTGNATFGLSPFYKKAASIVGDASFQATRRAWISAAASNGITAYGYLFTEPGQNTSSGVAHASELNYVYGVPTLSGPTSQSTLSSQIMDYWISFAVTGNPNDGRGSNRPPWPAYNTQNPQILQLNSKDLATIPDNYRQAQIDLINATPAVFAH